MRRWSFVLVGVLALVLAGAVGGWLALRSNAGLTGLCASAPTGLKERNFPRTVVLTNFRFGSVDDFYGIGASVGRQWPHAGIDIAVINEGPDSTPPVRRTLQVSRSDFRGFEGSTWPTAHIAVRSQDRFLDAYAEIRTVTPAAIATVNRALADVHACAA